MSKALHQIIVKQATLPILTRSAGEAGAAARFPINRIFCVGRNYREHALEMGGDPDREPPFFFTKPADAIVDTSGGSASTCVVPYPPMTSSLHFEGELVVAIGKDGLRIPESEAEGHIFGYAVGCDLTRRDLQAEAKKKGRPWDAAKGFDHSGPCGSIVPKEEADISPSTILNLTINGKLRQETALDKMVWNIPETISYLSTLFSLKPGDLIFTGTPAGVGEVKQDDVVSIACGDLPPCNFVIGPPE
mmetsp:Transcript_10221/g.28663  ORF Transcript_10221/g.28663 Transcript_10221/m.28663 type:complete len:247 (+) Transcript_10221:113-853(+)